MSKAQLVARVETQLTRAESAASYGRYAELRRVCRAGLRAADDLETVDLTRARHARNRFQWLAEFYGK